MARSPRSNRTNRSESQSDTSSGTPIPFFGTNPGVDGADFDRSVLYEDRFAPESIDLSSTEPQIDMDPLLRQFLYDHGRIDNIYIDTMLIWNGIRTYQDFKEFVVDTHSFTDMEHVYMKLGPNALGQKVCTTERLVMLGHYIATKRIQREDGTEGPMVLFDPDTNIFRPEAFDGNAWKQYYLKKRRDFGARFSRASVITFNVHRDSLHVVGHSRESRRNLSFIRTTENHVLNTSASIDLGGTKGDNFALHPDHLTSQPPTRDKSTSKNSSSNASKRPASIVHVADGGDDPRTAQLGQLDGHVAGPAGYMAALDSDIGGHRRQCDGCPVKLFAESGPACCPTRIKCRRFRSGIFSCQSCDFSGSYPRNC